MALAPGTSIEVVTTKWGDRPHWRFSGVYLGEDAHGEWLGFPIGTHFTRPGMAYDAEVDSVTVVPPDEAWFATFHAPGIWVEVYVDIALPARWDGTTLRMVDLDLDVIRRSHHDDVYLADEEEFAEHRVAYHYPTDVVAMAEQAAAQVLEAVQERRPPYDGTAEAWLAKLDDLVRRAHDG